MNPQPGDIVAAPLAGGRRRKPLETVVIEGTTDWMRHDWGDDGDRCICCEGNHVFSYDLVTGDERRWRDAVYDVVFAAPEGVRLRITIEQLPHPESGERGDTPR